MSARLHLGFLGMRLTPQLGRSLQITGVDADDERLTAEIQAMPRGIVAWLLRRIGISSVRALSVAPQGFRFERTGFVGDYRHYYPASQVATTVFEQRRPRGLLVLSLVFLMAFVGTKLMDLGSAHNQLIALGEQLNLKIDTEVSAWNSLIWLAAAIACLILYVLVDLLRYAQKRTQVMIGLVSSGGRVEHIRLHADRFEAQNLQRVLRVMEAVLDRGRHAEPSALAEIPPTARDRFMELPQSSARRYENQGSTLDPQAASAASGSDSGADTLPDTLPPITAAPPAAPSGRSPVASPAAGIPPVPPPVPPPGAICACPHCQARMRVPPAMVGKVVRCPSCGREARVG